MAELIPSLNTCLPKMTAGEKRVARRLCELLEDDYLIWFDIPLGSKRRYPDFIILHPSRGLLFLEVKDWKAENLRSISHTSVELLTAAGVKTEANPLEQARQCAYQVLEQLQRDPQLVFPSGKYKGKMLFPYGWGVVFTNVTRKQFSEGLPEEARAKVLPDHLLVCKEELGEDADPEQFQQQLWNMFNYQFGSRLTLPQIDRLRWHLFPELRIGSQQGGLFDGPSGGSGDLAEEIPEIVRIMDLQQEQLARSIGDGHRVIHGVAGSGKTLILGYRCLHLAQLLHQPILVLCFNIALAARLRSFIDAKSIGDKVQVYHFHDWCGEQLRAYHVEVPAGDGPYWDRQVEAVVAGVERGQIPQGQYGALLIDEGHDFEPLWLQLVTRMVDPATNSLLLLYDDAQAIYKRKTMKFSLASVGIQAQGRTTILRLNYRNSREILQFAYDFARDYFREGDADIPLVEPEAAGGSGEAPALRQFATLQQEVDFCLRCVQHWHESGVALRDIAILYPGGMAGTSMAKALQRAGLPFFWLATSSSKKNYKPDEARISVMPIPSSKGLEFERVIVLDSTFIPKGRQDADNAAEEVRKLYVGLTRAKSHLVVTYHRDNILARALRARQQ